MYSISQEICTRFLLCCALLWLYIDWFSHIHQATSLALWQSNDCPSASKATLMNMDRYFMWIHYEWLHNHNKAKHNKTVCIFLGIYCSSRPGEGKNYGWHCRLDMPSFQTLTALLTGEWHLNKHLSTTQPGWLITIVHGRLPLEVSPLKALRPRQNGRHLSDISSQFSCMETVPFWFNYHWNCFSMFHLTKEIQQCFG